MTLCYFPGSTEAFRGLERARLDLMSAIVYSGTWPRADADTPIKLLRAFFGPRWVSRDVIDMDDCMIEEATEFLHRVALEMKMKGPDPSEQPWRAHGKVDADCRAGGARLAAPAPDSNARRTSSSSETAGHSGREEGQK